MFCCLVEKLEQGLLCHDVDDVAISRINDWQPEKEQTV
jgi:hypothetical protein